MMTGGSDRPSWRLAKYWRERNEGDVWDFIQQQKQKNTWSWRNTNDLCCESAWQYAQTLPLPPWHADRRWHKQDVNDNRMWRNARQTRQHVAGKGHWHTWGQNVKTSVWQTTTSSFASFFLSLSLCWCTTLKSRSAVNKLQWRANCRLQTHVNKQKMSVKLIRWVNAAPHDLP